MWTTSNKIILQFHIKWTLKRYQIFNIRFRKVTAKIQLKLCRPGIVKASIRMPSALDDISSYLYGWYN
jgi:hypothetical protein